MDAEAVDAAKGPELGLDNTQKGPDVAPDVPEAQPDATPGAPKDAPEAEGPPPGTKAPSGEVDATEESTSRAGNDIPRVEVPVA